MIPQTSPRPARRPFPRFIATGAAVLALAILPRAGIAVETRALTDTTFAEFNKGVSTGTQILDTGRVMPGPQPRRLAKSDDGVAWSIATDPATGAAFYATGHSGKVYRVDASGKQELWADLTEVQATAVAWGPDDRLYIGASPGGKIYTAETKGKPALFVETGEKYVWDLAFSPEGHLFAATGTAGKIYRIEKGAKKAELFYDSDATNVMQLAFDATGQLLAATQGKAYLMQISAEKQAYILYSASQDELRSLTVDADGTVYAAANSARISSVFDKSSTSTASPDVSKLSGEGVVVKVYPNGFVDALWKAPEGPIHALLADDSTSSILAAAGKNGKLYRISTSDGSYSVIADVDEPIISALGASAPGRVFLATANKTALYAMETSAPAAVGLFASRALNAESTVQWGNLTFDGEFADEAPIHWETRSGNTPEPSDDLWSPWTSATAIAPRIVKVDSPVAQYLQYRILFTQKTPGTPASTYVDSVRVYFVEKNIPPTIKSITVQKLPSNATAAQAAALTAAAARLQSASGGKSEDSKAKEASEEAAKAATAAARAARSAVLARAAAGADIQNTQKFNITWSASDPNEDTLRYSLYYKGEDERVWKLIEEDLTDAKHQFSTEAIPDGQYRFKVEATDRFDNPATSASTVQLTSRVYTVDNTPPEIEGLKATPLADSRFEITFKGNDKTSILANAEYNLNASDQWLAIAPEDGIFDFHSENFRFQVHPEKPQPEHTLSIRVYDREGNSRVEKILLNTPAD